MAQNWGIYKQKDLAVEMTHHQDNQEKYTYVFITINTNQRDPSLLPLWQEACAAIFSPANITKYIAFTNQQHTVDTHIDSIDIEYAREVGPKTQTIHVHALIKIEHHSHIKLLTRELREDLRTYMQIDTAFHSKVDYIRANLNEVNLKRYLRKQ